MMSSLANRKSELVLLIDGINQGADGLIAILAILHERLDPILPQAMVKTGEQPVVRDDERSYISPMGKYLSDILRKIGDARDKLQWIVDNLCI